MAATPDHELVVAADGSIPAAQLAPLGAAPGSHLRVVKMVAPTSAERLAGAISDFPDLSWEDFEHGSALARRDLSQA